MHGSRKDIYQPLLDKHESSAKHLNSSAHENAEGPLLGRIDNIHTSQEFLEECTYFIELNDIYELVSSCYYHEDMDFCPVLVKIKSEEIMKNKGCKYLLQVWRSGGKKVYEKKLQGEIDIWCVAYKYFIFKPSRQDDNSDYFHIVNLKDNTTHLIKDVGSDSQIQYLTYAAKKLYVASQNTLQIFQVDLKDELKDQYQEPKLPYVINIEPTESRIHGLFTDIQIHKYHDEKGELKEKKKTLIIVALETNDQQIDFNELKLNKPTSLNAEPSHKFIQYREVIPRRHHDSKDPIEVFRAIFKKTKHENILVAVVMRQTKAYDIYYSGSRVYTSIDTRVRDIDLSFNFIALIMSSDRFTNKEVRKIHGEKVDEEKEAQEQRDLARGGAEEKTLLDIAPNESRVRLINLKWESKVGYENSEHMPHAPNRKLFYWRIKNHCKIFNSFCLSGTVLLVAHGNIISLFSILLQKWVKHFIYDTEIREIFRDGHNQNQIAALFIDQTIKIIKQQKIVNTGEDQEPWIDDPSVQIEIPKDEKLIDYHYDRENNKWLLFITQRGTKEQQTYGVYALYNSKLYNITEQFVDGFSAKPNLVFLFSVNEHTEFIVQHHHQIDLYTIDFEEVKDEFEEEKEELEGEKEDEKKDDKKDNDDEEEKEVKVEEKKEVIKVPKIRPVQTNIDTAETDDQGKITKKIIKRKISDGVKFQLHEQHHQRSKPKYFIFLSDTKNFYKIDLQTQKIQTFDNQQCIGFYFSDNNYLYTLSQQSGERSQGLRMYDLENVIEKSKDYSYLLTDTVQVGCQGAIDFSHENERVSFLSSYDNIEVIPLLHRNTMSFIGMKNRNSYLATKVVDGKFIALGNKGKVYAWDLITGKLITNRLNEKSYKHLKDYQVYRWEDDDEDIVDNVYKKEWYDKILLRKKTPLENYDRHLAGHGGVVEGIKNQVAYKDRIEQKFYEFKVVEIINENEIKEHINFVHVIFPNYIQYLYFSNDLKYMYERLKYEKHFIYEVIPAEDGSNNITMKYAHRIHNLPVDLLHVTQYPFIMTPSFNKYLDVDETHTRLLIRSTMQHEIILDTIPIELVDGKKGNLEEQVRRIRWIDDQYLHIINEEGIERIVDTNDNFKEVQFNFIPLYDKEISKKHHYIMDHPSYRLAECIETLKKRYRGYKSSYNMKRSADKNYDLYNDIFDVDYRVDNCNGQFEVDMSFSILHWRLTEQLHSGQITLDQIDDGQVQLLIYNIFPHGDTVFHKLHDQGDLIEGLLKIAHPNPEDRTEINIHLPFLQNMNGKSPIHLCAEHSEFRYINVFLEYLSAYGIDHHSRAIYEKLPVMVEHQLPNFIPYLESRVRQTEQSAKINKGMLKETNYHGLCTTSLWIGKDAIDKLFQPAPIEQDVRLQFLDIPSIHCFTSETGVEFFKTLSASEDMKLFETTAVKKLIEFQWPLILKHTIYSLFIPYICFLFFYQLYLRYLMPYSETENPNLAYVYIGEAFLVVFSLYLLGNEIKQLFKQGSEFLEYFISIWNYLDFLPPTFIIIFLILTHLGFFNDDAHTHFKAVLQALMSLFIWLKLLYFLRIFDSTGYLIRIIIQVIIDMRHFLFILLLTFVAFGDAILNISLLNDTAIVDGGFTMSVIYIYRMVLGDFDTTGFGEVAVPLMWILFILCTVFNMIIMLNLLIAIISESFANINSVSKQASYQEKARMISENLYLIPQNAREAFCSESTYILNAVDTEEELQEHQEDIDQKLKTLRKKLKESIEKMFAKQDKRIKKQSQLLMRMAGLPTGMSMAGSVRGGSVYNMSVGHSAGQHH